MYLIFLTNFSFLKLSAPLLAPPLKTPKSTPIPVLEHKSSIEKE